VTHAGTWFGQVRQALPQYERLVRDHFPDVLVVNYGVIECQSNALPAWVVRHLTTWDRTSRRGARAYRELVVPRLWPSLRDYQRWASARDRGRTHRHPPRRFVADLTRLVDLVRKDCGCLVLLVDIDPPGPRVEHWLPGTAARVAHYNALLAQVADRYDDAVRLVPAGALLDDPERLLPDGLHRTPEGHARTAALLADAVCDWLAA
jgi:lysophospholipase L1-like esterase